MKLDKEFEVRYSTLDFSEKEIEQAKEEGMEELVKYLKEKGLL